MVFLQFFVGGFFGGGGGGRGGSGSSSSGGGRASDLSSLFSNVLFSASEEGAGGADHDLDPVQLRDEESEDNDDTDEDANDETVGDDVGGAAARGGRLFERHRRRRGLDSEESRRRIDRNNAFPRYGI